MTITIQETHNLTNALFYLDYVKCAHEGTARMRDYMKGADLPPPEFGQREVGNHQVHVTLQNNIEARKEFIDTSALKLIGTQVYETLSMEEKTVINFVAEKNKINVTDAVRLLHLDWARAKSVLQGLAERQSLMRRAKSSKDRSAAH